MRSWSDIYSLLRGISTDLEITVIQLKIPEPRSTPITDITNWWYIHLYLEIYDIVLTYISNRIQL